MLREASASLRRQDYRSHYCVLDISLAQKFLGYQPEFLLKKGVKDYVRAITSGAKE